MLISVTLLLSFDKMVGYFCGRSHLANQMLGEMVETGSGEIFVRSAPWKGRTGFCLLEEKHPYLAAYEQATASS